MTVAFTGFYIHKNIIEETIVLKNLLLAAILALGLSVAPIFAQDIEYLLINNTSHTVIEFYTSPSDSHSWDEDLLGYSVLHPGQQGIVLIADGQTQCEYDLLFVFDDGSELADSVDICRLNSYELVD